MLKNPIIKYIVVVNIISLSILSLIDLQTRKMWHKFDKDTQVVHDTTNIDNLIKTYNNWVIQKDTRLGFLYQLEKIQQPSNKISISNRIFDSFVLWNIEHQNFEIWQILTHMFVHGGFFHFLFNMISLITLGLLVIQKIGNQKFLLLYISGGIIASLTHMILTSRPDLPMLGSSGAIWAIFALFAHLYRDEKLSLFLLPIYIKAKYLFLGLLLIEIILGIHNDFLTNKIVFINTDQTAHWAHVGGAISGLIYYRLIKHRIK